MKTKVCHIFSDVEQSFFLTAIFDFMDKEKYEICFVMVGERRNDFYDLLRDKGCEIHFVELRGRRNLPVAILKMRKLLRTIGPDIVHTHLVDGSLVGLIGAKLAGISKRVSTRHHSNECHEYFPHAVYYDKIVNYLSRYVIANTQITAEVLTELDRAPSRKVIVQHYAYDTDQFTVAEEDVNKIRLKYDLKPNQPVVGVVSRFVHWKGVQHIIPAFKQLLADYPDAKLVFANGIGVFENEIQKLLDEHLRPDQYVLITFEREIYALFGSFDIFIHVPIGKYYEAFGQIYVEALGIGVPSVFTISGIANDFVVDEVNALVVPYCDSNAVYNAMKRMLADEVLRQRITVQGKADVKRMFGIDRLTQELDQLYSEL